MKNVCIVTANFGDKNLISDLYLEQNIDNKKYNISFFSYNDKNTSSRINSLHPRTKSKIPKMLQWMEFEFDYYIWLDSKFKIKSKNLVNDFIDYIENYDICLFNHPQRNSIKSESDYVLSEINQNYTYLKTRYDGERIKEQVEFYLKDKSFIDNKLFALGMFIYSKNLVIDKNYNLMTDWFFHNCYWSIQDQISFPYLLHKHKINFKTFNFNIIDNNYTKYKGSK